MLTSSTSEIRIRRFLEVDATATARVFFDSVHNGAHMDYTEEQRRAWAAEVPNTKMWLSRLSQQAVFVAEKAGCVVGFMSLTTDGHIDLAFVAPDWIGHGVGKALYEAIVAEALRRNFSKMTVEASHAARVFFERQGWTVVRAQTVERQGIYLENFAMERVL